MRGDVVGHPHLLAVSLSLQSSHCHCLTDTTGHPATHIWLSLLVVIWWNRSFLTTEPVVAFVKCASFITDIVEIIDDLT